MNSEFSDIQSSISEPADDQTQSYTEADNRADAIAILIIFCAAVAFAVYYASGWAPNF